MKRNNTIVPILLLLLASQSLALYKIDYPNFKELKELHYETRLKDSGKVIFREEVNIALANFDGQEFLFCSALSRGKTIREGEIYRFTKSYYAIDENNRLSTYAHEVTTSLEGLPYQSFQLDYDWDKNQASYNFQDLKKKKSISRTITLDQQTIFARDTTLLFPSLILNKVREEKIRMVLPTGHIFKVIAAISYLPEEFTIGGKKIDCYRIEMKPDFPLLTLIAPKITFWYLAAPPYNFVRYEGPLAGPFSPTVIQEQVF